MPKKSPRVPKYCLFRPRNLAYCRVKGKPIYLGKYNSPQSRQAYAKIIDALALDPEVELVCPPDPNGLTIIELCKLYLDFAEGYYCKNGEQTPHVRMVKMSIRILLADYESLPAAKFGPKALKTIRRKLEEEKKTRKHINSLVDGIRRIFKWAVGEEFIHPAIHQALLAVEGLKKGRTEAPETDPVKPVAEAVVNATLEYLTPIVVDMVRFQRLTGCRPGELCQLRPMDIERSGKIWTFRPGSHKTEHHEKHRTIYIGPKAQAIILPYLGRPAEAYCFDPRDTVREINEALQAKRKMEGKPPRKNIKNSEPIRPPKAKYTADSYRRAIIRAVNRANKKLIEDAKEMGLERPQVLPAWHPNQLRHNAATMIRKLFGLEGAQVILGHSKADVTEIYAERDMEKALEIIEKIG